MKRMAFLAGMLAIGVAGPATAGEAAQPVQYGGYHPAPPAEGYEYPDCYCTDSQGDRVELGDTACLLINSQSYLAQCDMSLNNPTWRRLQEGCPVS